MVVPPFSFSRGKPKISPIVANQYLSHVSKFLLDNLFISKRDELRSDRARDILRGLVRLHPDSQIPWRLRCKIPITYSILLVIIKFIYDHFHRPAQLPLRRALCAAFSLGFALSLRPQEYLPLGTAIPLWKQANSSLAYFWFPGYDVPFSVCSHSLSHLVVLLPTSLFFWTLIKITNLVMVVHALYRLLPLTPHSAASIRFLIFFCIIHQPQTLPYYLVLLLILSSLFLSFVKYYVMLLPFFN